MIFVKNIDFCSLGIGSNKKYMKYVYRDRGQEEFFYIRFQRLFLQRKKQVSSYFENTDSSCVCGGTQNKIRSGLNYFLNEVLKTSHLCENLLQLLKYYINRNMTWNLKPKLQIGLPQNVKSVFFEIINDHHIVYQ